MFVIDMRSCLIHLINNLYFFPESREKSTINPIIESDSNNSLEFFSQFSSSENNWANCVCNCDPLMEHGEQGRNGSIIHSNNLSTIAMRYEAPLSDFYPRICYPFSTAMKFTFLLPASLYSFLFLLSYEMLFKHLFYYSICSKFPASRDS